MTKISEKIIETTRSLEPNGCDKILFSLPVTRLIESELNGKITTCLGVPVKTDKFLPGKYVFFFNKDLLVKSIRVTDDWRIVEL